MGTPQRSSRSPTGNFIRETRTESNSDFWIYSFKLFFTHMLDELSILGGILASFIALRLALRLRLVRPRPGILTQVGFAAFMGLSAMLMMFAVDVGISLDWSWFFEHRSMVLVFVLQSLCFVAVLGLDRGLSLPFRTCLTVGLVVGLAFAAGAIAPLVFTRFVYSLFENAG